MTPLTNIIRGLFKREQSEPSLDYKIEPPIGHEEDPYLNRLNQTLPNLALETLINYHSNNTLNKAIYTLTKHPTSFIFSEEKKRAIILKVYQTLSYLREEFLDTLVLSELLKGNILETKQLSLEQIEAYSLSVINTKTNKSYGECQEWGRKQVGKKRFEVYLDTPIAISLMYQGLPNALVGVTINEPSTLSIHQLQGVRPNIPGGKTGGSWALIPLDWKKMLVETVELLADQLRFKELSIQSGKNNTWYKGGLSLKKSAEIYDQTAERLGFYQKKDQNWYKTLRRF